MIFEYISIFKHNNKYFQLGNIVNFVYINLKKFNLLWGRKQSFIAFFIN